MVKTLYVVWIKINETLPWVELENEYQTRAEARKEAKKILNHAKIKIVTEQKKTKRVKVLATIK
jgi:hypothetical protein